MTKQEKIKKLMNLGIQRTFTSWNRLSEKEINKAYQDAVNLGLIKEGAK